MTATVHLEEGWVVNPSREFGKYAAGHREIDNTRTIATFLENLNRLSGLPLLTDEEMERLFGEETTTVIRVLDEYNKKHRLCADCTNRCCLIARCELYDPEFDSCPIHEMRPLVCRMHFCKLFQFEGSLLAENLSDIFFECLLAADRGGNSRVRLFDAPPMAITAPLLIEKTAPITQALKKGKINPAKATELIHWEAAKYRVERINEPGY